MNFYNDDEKKDGAPVMPSAASPFKKSSAFGKAPMFSRAAGSITDRLKNLSRKDMAFVAIGLSVLVMAPVAEYMMSQPGQDNMLKEGFGTRDGGSSPYEPGVNGLSQGSSDGSGEVITPLSARDPMSLILGSQAAQPPAMPPAAPPATSYRDAMKESGRNAFSEATKSAGAPTVIRSMQGLLRIASSFSDGGGGSSRTSGTLGGGKIIEDAQSASSKAAKRSMLGPVAMAGYKGVASNTPNSSSKGAFEKLRAQADKSAGNFSGGSAMNSLDKAAADAIDLGKGGGGMGAGGDSEKTKPGSGSTTKYDHSRSGETLAEAAAKARQAKALEWEFFKKYEIPKQIINAIVGAISTEVGKFAGGLVGDVLNPSGPGAPKRYCWKMDSNNRCYVAFPMSECTSSKDVKAPDCGCLFSDTSSDSNKPPAGKGCSNESATPVTGPGTSPGNAGPVLTWPPSIAVNFDAQLTALRMNIKDAADDSDHVKDFTKKAADVAGFLYELSGQGTKGYEFPYVVGNSITKIDGFQKSQLDYKTKAGLARTSLDALRRQNKELLARLEAAAPAVAQIAKTKGEELTRSKGAIAEIVNDDKAKDKVSDKPNDITTEINNHINLLKTLAERTKLHEDELAFCERSAEFYGKQAGSVKAAASGLREKSITISGEARAAMEEMRGYNAAVQTGPVPPEMLEKISTSFKKVTGQSVVVADSTAPAAAAKQGEIGLVDQLLALRGADKTAYWDKAGKVDDSKFKDQEPKDWALISPKKKITNLTDKLESPEIAEALKVAPVLNIRAEDELPDDLVGLSQMLTGLHGGDKGVIDLTKSESDKLKIKVDALLGTGGGTPGGNTGGTPGGTPVVVTPVVTVDPALAGRKTALLANANLTGSKYDAATAVHKGLGKGQNAQYARADYKDMTTSRAEITRLAGELSAEGAKPTKEKLDELELHTNNFNTAYGEFKAHAKAAGAPAPVVVVRPPQPIIINNNVQGGNANAVATANATAGATVKPTTNNNTTNNTVVKPPVQPVVPPVVQAKPATTSQTLKFTMPDSRQMTLQRTQLRSNEAVYQGWHRLDGSFLLILANSAYNYRVTCTSTGDKPFKVTMTEIAPVAFPGQEETSFIVKVAIKKFLRMEDIQMGRYTKSQMFLGQSCNQ